jgi:hypothetical protein
MGADYRDGKDAAISVEGIGTVGFDELERGLLGAID